MEALPVANQTLLWTDGGCEEACLLAHSLANSLASAAAPTHTSHCDRQTEFGAR